VARRKFFDVAEERVRRGRGEKREIVIERILVNLGLNGWVCKDRFDLGGEDEATATLLKVERLDA
jgi:hypothetical protein